jgi:hypothetical protein
MRDEGCRAEAACSGGRRAVDGRRSRVDVDAHSSQPHIPAEDDPPHGVKEDCSGRKLMEVDASTPTQFSSEETGCDEVKISAHYPLNNSPK